VQFDVGESVGEDSCGNRFGARRGNLMKNSRFTDFVFKGTYYFANMISNILDSPYDYIRSLSEFWHSGDAELSINFKPFPKESVFHSFIYFIIESSFFESLPDSEKLEEFKKNYAAYTSSSFGFMKEPFLTDIEYYAHHYNFDLGHPWIAAEKNVNDLTEDDVSAYFEELPLYHDGYENLLKVMSNEVFNVLFTNRLLMGNFNLLIARVISSRTLEAIPQDYVPLFKCDGVLKRAKIPEWAKRAIIFRDHGYCVKCHKDVSIQRRNNDEAQIDHIIPLADGGLNDISNLQLLCKHCNTQKGDRYYYTSNSSIDWYK